MGTSGSITILHFRTSLPKTISDSEKHTDSVCPFEESIDQRAQTYRAVDCGIVVPVQKVFDIAFVPPIDIPTGTVVTD